MKKRMLSLTLAALMLTGCAGKGGSSSSMLSSKEESSAPEAVVSGTTAQTSTETKSKKNVTLTIAVSGDADSELTKQITEFNGMDNGCWVTIKKYPHLFGSENREQDVQNFRVADLTVIQDIINSDDIDIVYNGSFNNQTTYELLKNKGAFADMYKFMENDSEVNPTELNGHILELNETDGKLYSFPAYYHISTLIGREEYVGDKENWTVDEFISKWEQAPDDMFIGTPYAEGVFRDVCRNLWDYIDFENGKADFDSDDFRRLLEFCGSFPSNNNQKVEETDWNKSFIMPYSIDSIVSASVFNDNFTHHMGKGKYTLAGFPSSDGCGAVFSDGSKRFSICANSSDEKQKAAWEFVRSFYTYDYQKEHAVRFIDNYLGSRKFESETGLCVNKKAFDDIAQEIIAGKYYSDYGAGTYQIPTQEDYKELCRYISETKKWTSPIDTELHYILNEETLAYLAGEISLDTAVDTLQNRISTWLSEKQ